MPRKGSEHKLTQARIQELLPQVPGWKLAEDGQALAKTYRFKNYYSKMSFVNALAHVAHSAEHHPAQGVHYQPCVARNSAHDGGGLRENDFFCDAKACLMAKGTHKVTKVAPATAKH